MKAIFIATMLILGSIASQEEGMETIKKLEASKEGKRILDTIALQLAAGDPADDLIHMLQDQEDALQAEQQAADDAILPLQNQCVVDLAQLVTEIQAARTKIQQQSDLISTLSPIKADKQAQKADQIELKGLIEAKLVELEEAKAAKDAEWAEEKEQHDSQIAIVQKAKDIVVSGLSASFLQTKAKASAQVLAQVGQHFNNAKKLHFKNRGMTSIFKVFATVASSQAIQADQEAIDKIVELFDNVLDKLAESRAIEKRDYDHFVTEYNKTKAGLTAKLNKCIAKIALLTAEIGQLTKRINLAEAELHEQEQRLAQKIAQHDERESFCDAAANTYAKEREARDDQQNIISDAIGLLTAKIRLLKRYVGHATADLSKPFP